ncbi:MAG: hypothetical protein KGS61_14515, partial [Verrucomicrobia bacterium]|nr:hypothetical protein [Verrucomicrobiota bacterium]
MNLLPSLQPVLDDLGKRFGAQLTATRTPQPNEVYLDTRMEAVAALAAYLYRKWNGRLAGVFAEDARADHGAYFVYYLFALDAAHGFILLQVPVPADHP